MNSKSLTFLVAFISVGCETPPETFRVADRDLPLTSFVDLRGRVSVADNPDDIPIGARSSAFAATDFPATFVWTGVRLEPQYVVRQRAHAGWFGVAQAQYVVARIETFREVPDIDAFEVEDGDGTRTLDPNMIALQRSVRLAITNEPTWDEFFAPPIKGVLVTKNPEQVDVPGGIQIVSETEGVDWISGAQKETRKPVRLPLFVNSKCIVYAATRDAIVACD